LAANATLLGDVTVTIALTGESWFSFLGAANVETLENINKILASKILSVRN